jgi:hypothetical protein
LADGQGQLEVDGELIVRLVRKTLRGGAGKAEVEGEGEGEPVGMT